MLPPHISNAQQYPQGPPQPYSQDPPQPYTQVPLQDNKFEGVQGVQNVQGVQDPSVIAQNYRDQCQFHFVLCQQPF